MRKFYFYFLVLILIACNNNPRELINSSVNNGVQDSLNKKKELKEAQLPIEYLGIYHGIQPAYFVKNKYGDDLEINGQKVPVPSSDFIFLLKENNVVSLQQTNLQDNSQYDYAGIYKIVNEAPDKIVIQCSLSYGNSKPIYNLFINKSNKNGICIAQNEPEFNVAKIIPNSNSYNKINNTNNISGNDNGPNVNLLKSLQFNELVAYYPFDGNANDSSGNNLNGNVYGATLTTDRFGNRNSAYYFDGTSSYISIPNDNSLNLTENFSISCWFAMRDYATNYNGSIILSKHNGDSGNDGYTYGIINAYHNDNQFLIFGANGISGYENPKLFVHTNEWYNFIVTFNKETDSLKYYLNGVLGSANSAPIQMLSNNLDLTIGYQYSPSGTYLDYFRGAIDDIRIYNRVLSSSEVSYLAKH